MKNVEFKKYLMKSMDLCFEKLGEMLSPTSEYYDSIVHLKLRYTTIINDQHKGIISENDRKVELNRIQLALIAFLNELEESDFELSNCRLWQVI